MKSNPVDNLALILQIISLQILFQDYNNSDLSSTVKYSML